MIDPGALTSSTAAISGWLLRTSLSAAGIAAIVLFTQFVFARWISPIWRYRLWGILVLRLLLPALPSSPASLANLNLMGRAYSLLAPVTPVRARLNSFPLLKAPTAFHPLEQSASVNTSKDSITVSVSTDPMVLPSTVLPPRQPEPEPAVPKVDLLPTLALVGWAIIAGALFLRLVVANITLSKRLKHALPVDDPQFLDVLQKCCGVVGINSSPELLITSAVSAPAAAGIFRRRILVPPGMLNSLSTDELRLVLLHELAHIRRNDVAANWLFAVVQIVHWFNPVLWLAFARLRADRELARDAFVLSLTEHGNPRAYVDTLLKLTESLSRPKLTDLLLPPKPQIAVGMYGGKHGLKRRLHMIARFHPSRRRMDWASPVLAVVLAGALLTNAKSQTTDNHPISPSTRPAETKPQMEHRSMKVPLLSEIPIAGRLFVDETDSPTTRPHDRSEIPALILKSKRATETGKYREALQSVDQILFIDPEDDYAVGVKPLLEDKVKFAAQRHYVEGPLRSDKPQSEKDKKEIQSLIERSREFTKNGKYANALKMIDEVIRLDPTNEYAAAIRPFLAETLAYDTLRQAREGADRPKGSTTLPSRIEAKEVLVEPDPKIETADAKARNLLDRTLPALQFDAVGFSDVIDFMRDISSANIFVNWKSLEAAGIDRNTPVSASLRNIKFSKALSVVLEAISGGQVQLGYTIDAGVITISTADDLARNVVVRVYDIRDLLMVIPDVVSAPAKQPAAAESHEDRVKALVKLIMDSVAPRSWKDRGGSVGAMRELEGQLIVTQTPEFHRQLVALLETVRESRFTQVIVESRFISCDEKLLADILDETKWGNPTTQPAGGSPQSSPSAFLTDDQVQQVMRAVQKSQDTTLVTAPRITLFNGQKAFIRVSTSRAYIGGYSATTKANGEVRYEPIPKTYEAGLVTNVTAATDANRKYVTLAIHPKLSVYLGSKRVPWPGSPKGVELMVEEPQVRTSELETTVSMPDGGTMLLGGMEDPGLGTGTLNARTPENQTTKVGADPGPASQPAIPHGDEKRRLYLLVRSTIIKPKQPESRALNTKRISNGVAPGLNDAQIHDELGR